MTETNRLTTTILWVLAAAYAVALAADIAFGLGIPIAVILLISVAFALLHGATRYVRFRPGIQTVLNFPRSHLAQAVLMYAVMGLTPVLTFVVGGSKAPVTDAAGVVWQTRSVAEAVATVSLYTMVFAVALSAVKLIQAPATATGPAADEATPAKRGVVSSHREAFIGRQSLQ